MHKRHITNLVYLRYFLIFLLIGLIAILFLLTQKSILPQHPQKNFKENSSLVATETKQKTNFSFRELMQQKKSQALKQDTISFIAVGDIMMSREVSRKIKAKGNDYIFSEVKDFLSTGDIVFGNLEAPITSGREILDNEMYFRTDIGTEEILKLAGFTILSLANNHTMNFQNIGILDTFSYLKKENILFSGAGINSNIAYAPVYVEKNNIRIAFLSYSDSSITPPSYEAKNTPGVAFMDLSKMAEQIKQAKEKTDLVIISMHSGTEYTKKITATQENFAKTAIDQGADLVIGHHPHIVQKIDQYKGKYIFYSLGNFIFDQMWSEETRQGLVAKFYLNKSGVERIDLHPVLIHDYSKPELADTKVSKQILSRLEYPLSFRQIIFYDQVLKEYKTDQINTIYTTTNEQKNISKTIVEDIDNDLKKEKYILENGKLTITENSKTIWQSPDEFWIDNFTISALSNSKTKYLNLSVWKQGDFGSSKPFWVKENNDSTKNHFFVYKLENNKIMPLWQSSNLSKPNCEFIFHDINNDDQNELIVIEGDYQDYPECLGKNIAIWKWNEWGFTNIWRSELGSYKNLEIEKNSRKEYIIVDNYGS